MYAIRSYYEPQGVEDAAGIQRGGQPALVLQQALQKRRESGIGGNLQQYGLTILSYNFV